LLLLLHVLLLHLLREVQISHQANLCQEVRKVAQY